MVKTVRFEKLGLTSDSNKIVLVKGIQIITNILRHGNNYYYVVKRTVLNVTSQHYSHYVCSQGECCAEIKLLELKHDELLSEQELRKAFRFGLCQRC